MPNPLSCLLQTWNAEISKPKAKLNSPACHSMFWIYLMKIHHGIGDFPRSPRPSGSVSIADRLQPIRSLPNRRRRHPELLVVQQHGHAKYLKSIHTQYNTLQKWAVCEESNVFIPSKPQLSADCREGCSCVS